MNTAHGHTKEDSETIVVSADITELSMESDYSQSHIHIDHTIESQVLKPLTLDFD